MASAAKRYEVRRIGGTAFASRDDVVNLSDGLFTAGLTLAIVSF